MPEPGTLEGGGGGVEGKSPEASKLPNAPPAPRLLDISRPLSNTTPVWPGDRPTSVGWTARIEDGANVNVGQVTGSLHAATHADAPLHFVRDGAAIDEVDLSAYYGRACILERVGTGPILPNEIRESLSGGRPLAPRVLFRTWPSGPPAGWVDDFAYFDPRSIHLLADLGAVLVGIDTPSFDAVDSADLPSHQALLERGLLNLENLNLARAEGGRVYTLSAFPIRVGGMDAAPVRAVLIDDRV
jgi:arylformamidase